MKINSIKKAHSIANRKSNWHRLCFSIVLFLIVYLMSGCIPTESKQPYFNSENGISLEKPGNWDLTFTERNGTTTLEAENGVWNKDSARIEIITGSCPDDPKDVGASRESSREILEQDIRRIKQLYASVTVAQEPMMVETKNYEITKAVILVPTMSMLDDSPRNQVGGPSPDIFQTIDLFILMDSNDTILAHVYKGNSASLNAEAQEIVNSLQRNCLDKP